MPNSFVEPNTWIEGAEVPLQRLGNIAVEKEGDIYIIAGGERGADLPFPDATNIVHIYHTKSDTWSMGRPMPHPAHAMGYAVVGSKIYCMGGKEFPWNASSPNEERYDCLEIYDLEADAWSTGASLPTKRSHMQCIAVNNKIYCMGGYEYRVNNYAVPSNIVQIYDIGTDTWRVGPSMVEPKWRFGCFLHGDQIYCVGGTDTTNGLTSFEVLDTATEEWTALPAMPDSADSKAYFAYNDKIYCVGGVKSSNVYAFDLILGQWLFVTSMPCDGSDSSACTILNDKLYLIGTAQQDGTNYNDKVLIYEFDTGNWSIGPNVPRERVGPFDCLAVDGKIYCINGINWPERESRVDIFIPADYEEPDDPGPDPGPGDGDGSGCRCCCKCGCCSDCCCCNGACATINFSAVVKGCDPERLRQLTKEVQSIIRSL